jgi:RNA polymerase-binding protein DksA
MNKTTHSKKDWRANREKLLKLAKRLQENISILNDEALRPPAAARSATENEPPAYQADPGVREAEDSVTLSIMGSEEHVLAETQAALTRIESGTYGVCEQCGKPITKTRLAALPYARHCIRCARDAEATT